MSRFAEWANAALPKALRHRVVAYNFNLYAGERSWDIELVGTSRFDAEDPDWACDSIFSWPELFRLPHEAVGTHREEALTTSLELVSTYLRLGREHEILQSSAGVGIGFVDGELTLLWPENAA